MPIEIDGSDVPVTGRYAIVVSSYNDSITSKLLSGAVEALSESGVADDDILVVRVPGAWELPLATRQLALRDDVRAVIPLGAVIRGDTSHDQHINRAVSLALMELMLESDKPIAFGVLTCNTLEQAIHRSGGNMGNKGREAAQAALHMTHLVHALNVD